MSIAPFLPALPTLAAPTNPEPGTTPESPGSFENPFGEALAAALAVLPPAVPMAVPTAAPTVAPTAPSVAVPTVAPTTAPTTPSVVEVSSSATPEAEEAAQHHAPSTPTTKVEEVAHQPSPDHLPSTPAPGVQEVAQQPSREPVTSSPATPLQTPPLEAPNVPPQMPVPPTVRTETPHVAQRAVVTQVFGEITRLASNGNGTHRITLTLQPAQLGEVKVTLVVRDGAVRVQLSGQGGDSAVRQALASGAPELQRMLERSGATEARVVVREAFGTNPTLAAPPAPAQSAQSTRQDAPGWSNQSSSSGQQPGHQSERHGTRPRHQQIRQQIQQPLAATAVAAGVVPLNPTTGRLDRSL